MAERKLIVGKLYRHFKGNVYRVTGIATDSETLDKLVIYQDNGGEYKLWARPYSSFISEVDKEKYPDATQLYRFEEVKK